MSNFEFLFSSIVINCPREDRYTVILTEMMANTTFTNIVNEIKGAQDSVVTDDASKDYIRRIEVTNVKVAFVKFSNERADPLYETSVIVVSLNEASDAVSGQYTVTRYWQNIYTNWIESELIFELVKGPYDDVFVFDKYAITIKDKNKVNAVYYDNFKGVAVNDNYESSIYDDL